MRIVTHNVFWFQGAPFETDQPGTPRPEIVEALAEMYRRLAPDVLALQEVQSPTAFLAIGEATGLAGAYSVGGELAQYGGAIFAETDGWIEDWRASECYPQRMWQIVRGEIDVASVHLPSNRHPCPEGCGRRRLAELAAVLAQLDGPSVIVGDLNEPRGGPTAELLSETGYLDAADATGQADRPTSLGGGRGDQVWVHESLRDRLTDCGVVTREEMAMDTDGTEHLSDHFPVWVELRD